MAGQNQISVEGETYYLVGFPVPNEGSQEWGNDLARNEVRLVKATKEKNFIYNFFPADCFPTGEQEGKKSNSWT